jgi:hypothetical protein
MLWKLKQFLYEKGILIPPHKCEFCGKYHFLHDSVLKCFFDMWDAQEWSAVDEENELGY